MTWEHVNVRLNPAQHNQSLLHTQGYGCDPVRRQGNNHPQHFSRSPHSVDMPIRIPKATCIRFHGSTPETAEVGASIPGNWPDSLQGRSSRNLEPTYPEGRVEGYLPRLTDLHHTCLHGNG